MIQLIYISSATRWPKEEDLLALLTQARERNLRQNVTGMLLYHNATYLQVLEGDSDDVHQIFNSIKHDTRNNGLVKLAECNIKKRDFPGGSMGFEDLTAYSSDELPGFVDIFNGKLDKDIACNNKTAAIRLLMNFAKQY